jgi:carbonic anhydrase
MPVCAPNPDPNGFCSLVIGLLLSYEVFRRAAVSHKFKGTRHLSRIQILVKSILPGLAELDSDRSGKDQLERAVEANLRWSMKQLLETPEGKKAAHEGRKRLVGAVFEINSGRVRFLDDSSAWKRDLAPH